MPVEPFVDSPEPDDPQALLWRYVNFWKFKDLVESGKLYLRRADKLNDEHEGLPAPEYERVLNLNHYDLNDIIRRDDHIGSLAQFRQAFYVSCWHLQDEETAAMWGRYGSDGVAIVTRYDIVKGVLAATPDRFLLGLMRYGTAHMTGWNVVRFVTTKREKYAPEREVRAMVWLTGTADAGNRHFDINDRPHDRPILDPPATMPEGVKRTIDVRSLIRCIVVSPHAPAGRLVKAEALLRAAGIEAPVRVSDLTPYRSFIPSDEELQKYLGR